MHTEFTVGMSKIYQVDEHQIICITDPEYSLSIDQQEALLQTLGPVTSEGFGHKVTDASLRKHAVTNSNYLLLVKTKKTFTGFASARNLPNIPAGVFLTGVVLSSRYQRKSLGSKILSFLIKVSRCRMLTFTTQSPVMYLMLKKISKVVYPGVEENPILPELQEMGYQIMKDRQGKFCPTTFVSRNLYSQCLYSKFPWSSDSKVNAFFKRVLHFDRDKTKDGFLLIGKIE